MTKTPRTASFKKKIALEAIKEDKTMSQIASQHGVHPIQVAKWKKELVEGANSIFERKNARSKDTDTSREILERKIGQLTIELDFLKKKLGM